MDKQWYVVNTYSGHENKVKDNLEKRKESHNLQDYIFRIIVAEHEVPVMKNGLPTGKTKMKNLYPGYVFIEMIMTDEAWFVVRNTPGVTGFIGSSGHKAKPTPLMPQEIDHILANMGMSRVNIESEMTVGSKVTIVDGPFKGMNGVVDSIDMENNRLNVLIDLFGQETPVEVELFQVKKIQ